MPPANIGKPFRSNFKTSTLCWLLLLFLGFLFADEGYIVIRCGRTDSPSMDVDSFLVLLVLDVMLALFTMAYIARFEDRMGRVLKNCLLIMFSNLFRGILLLLLLAVFITAVVFFPPMLLLAPASYMLLASYVLEKIFRRYMSQEDLEKERERNSTANM